MMLSQLFSNETINPTYDISITGLTDDSRSVKPGNLFFVRQGSDTSGEIYLEAALKNGASCVLSRNKLVVNDKPLELSRSYQPYEVLANFYKVNLKEWKKFGVTGTNGKSTVACLVSAVLNYDGSKNLLLGTLGNAIGKNVTESQLTTPGVFEFYRWLSEAQQNKATSLSMEVSSHALDQGRINGVSYDVVLLTNLSQDHLDYHKTMDAYLEAKSKLVSKYLANDGVAWVWSEDKELAKIEDERIRYYGVKNSDTKVEILKSDSSGISINVNIDEIVYSVDSPLIGDFNIDNLVGAIAVAHSFGIKKDSIQEALKTVSVPGRLEKITLPIGDAFVDYAHTPDALGRVLSTTKEITKNKLVVVFGCGGDRDKTKRPLMAKKAEEYADVVFATSDNPRTENPDEILEDVVSGFNQPQNVRVISDRETAITLAASELKEGDVLVVAGKGHEDYQIIGTQKIHFDDREVLREWGDK
jgi:UDP-N-acetylmuramoyl-L-alanyl-D-glutamate--2,6-diaminopimelate ligase